MRQWEELMSAVVKSEKELGNALTESLQELNLSVSEFSERSELSQSTIYKIKSGHRDNIQLDSFRDLVLTLRQIEHGQKLQEHSVAVITNRESLEEIKHKINTGGYEVSVYGYPCSTVEEAIRQSILAEREGVSAIICGPITAYTVENIVHTPVVGLDVNQTQVKKAIQKAIDKKI